MPKTATFLLLLLLLAGCGKPTTGQPHLETVTMPDGTRCVTAARGAGAVALSCEFAPTQTDSAVELSIPHAHSK